MPRDRRLYMTFPIDFDEHPKVAPLSDAAFRAFVEMNGYSRRHDLDGRIPVKAARRKWKVRALAELVASHAERPLVLLDGDDYVIRDYAEHQFTADDLETLRQRRSEAGAKGAAKRWHGDSKPMASAMADGSQGANVDEWQKMARVQGQRELATDVASDSSSDAAAAAIRPDVEELLDHLESRIRANGSKVPTRGTRSRQAMRLLLDADGHTIEQVHKAIDWCQNDEFWRTNILSATKLREKYDQLRLAAQRPAHGSGRGPTRDDENLALVAQLAAEEQRRLEIHA